jgi:hypothetical protein
MKLNVAEPLLQVCCPSKTQHQRPGLQTQSSFAVFLLPYTPCSARSLNGWGCRAVGLIPVSRPCPVPQVPAPRTTVRLEVVIAEKLLSFMRVKVDPLLTLLGRCRASEVETFTLFYIN